jgi:hypothetical protein
MPRRVFIAGCFAMLLALPTHAFAAAIFTQSVLSAESDLDNSGTLVAAMNLVAAGSGPATVNGILFSTTNTIGTFTNWDPYAPDVSYHFAVGSPLDQVLSNFWFQPTNVVTARINLANLVPDTEYRVQLLIAHQSQTNRTGRNAKIQVQGESITLTQDIVDEAALVTINFTATGSSETIIFGGVSDDYVDRAVLNAIAVHQVQEVPAPSGIALISIGGIVALRRRR